MRRFASRPAALAALLLFGSAAAIVEPRAESAPSDDRISAARVERDAAGNVVRTEAGEELLWPPEQAPDPGRDEPVPATPSATLVPRAAPGPEGPYTLDFDEVWSYAIWGTSLGRSGIEPADLDGDGNLEIVLGTSFAGGFSSNNGWFVLEHQPASGRYAMSWSSGPIAEGVSRVAVLEFGGRSRILVGLRDGTLRVHDGATRSLETSFAAAADAIEDILLADADNDGEEEIVLVTRGSVHLLRPSSYASDGEIPYGGYGAAVGNVDGDPELEIVLSSGPVIQYDGLAEILEWDFSTFAPGRYVVLTDLDGDGMQEIVAARSWYYIDVYDGDLRSPKFQIDADLDIHALLAADVTGDGRDEILYGDGQWGSVYALEAATGDEIWSIRNPEHGITRVAVADTDDDGALEVMWGGGWTSTGEDFFFVHDIATKALEFQSVDLVGPFAAMAQGDVDDDGSEEIVAVSWESNSGYDSGVVHVFDAATFELEWQSGTSFLTGTWTGVQDAAIGDVDDDGSTEIVIATAQGYTGALFVLDGKTHAMEGSYRYDSGSPMQAIRLADFDGDGETEILAGNGRAHTGSPGNYFWVIDGKTGAVEWKTVSLGTSWAGVTALEVGHLDGDGVLDAAVLADSVWVLDGATRSLRKTLETGFGGLDVSRSAGNASAEIWTGTSGGDLVRIDPSSMGVSGLGSVCTGTLNSVKLDRSEALVGSVQFACGDDFGVWGLFEEAVLWRSSSLGNWVGYRNNLLVSDQGEERARFVVGTRDRILAYEGFGSTNTDVDEDGVLNHLDNCPELPNPDQADTDGDRTGDACNDADDGDGDEWADWIDNCPETANPLQDDADGNGLGDLCNDAEDADGDEWADALDNCPEEGNPAQTDRDGDRIGDACDPYPDNPDNYAARCEEAVANEALYTGLFEGCSEELALCESKPLFSDADGDGEEDGRDRCPDTPAGQAVDEGGCSQAQFCAAVAFSEPKDLLRCLSSDWHNDEPLSSWPRDCRFTLTWTHSRWQGGSWLPGLHCEPY